MTLGLSHRIGLEQRGLKKDNFGRLGVYGIIPYDKMVPYKSKRVLMHNLSYENEFDLQDNERASKTHFHKIGCAPGLVLKQQRILGSQRLREKANRKWPIVLAEISHNFSDSDSNSNNSYVIIYLRSLHREWILLG